MHSAIAFSGDLLWTGTAYQEFELWRGRYPGALTSLEERFAKGMADKARRKKRLVRAAVAAIVLVSTGVAIAIGVSRHKAVVAAQHAEASKLLALAQLKLQEDPTEALAFTTASLELADTKEARLSALRAIDQAPPAWEVASNIRDAGVPIFSPNGRYLAVGATRRNSACGNESGGPPLRLPGHEPSPRAENRARWASDDLLVTGLYALTTDRQATRVYVWSIPAGRKLRTIDFGCPTSWQIGPRRLLGETEVASLPGVVDLRSWRLPDGEPEALGRVDAAKLGMNSSSFEPNGRGWLYTVGTTTRLLPLPIGREGDRVFSRHTANVRFQSLHGRPEFLFQHAEDGENRLIQFSRNGPAVTTTLPKPASAPSDAYGTTSDRWVNGNPAVDAKLQPWDTSAIPGARPLDLRREGSWYAADSAFDPTGQLVVATTHRWSRLTFWPVPQRPPIVIDGYKAPLRPLAFSPDGKWLATSWADDRLRLWPLPGSSVTEAKVLNAPTENVWTGLAFDPNGRYLFAVGSSDNAWIVPLDGSPDRKLDQYSKDTLLLGAAVSPTGRRVATAYNYGQGPKTPRVWDVETGKVRLFDLPVPPPPAGSQHPTLTGYEGGMGSLAFLDDSTLFTGGDGGIRRWNLDTGTNELMLPAPGRCWLGISSEREELLFCKGGSRDPASCGVINLSTGATRSLGALADASSSLLGAVTSQGSVFALLGRDGSVRVGLHSGGEPHLLLGHVSMPDRAAISPDLRWVASTGEDNTLRLWPMPDLSKPPLHTLLHAEFPAKLKSLTNLRAVRDPASATGWKIDLAPFPGWKNLPHW